MEELCPRSRTPAREWKVALACTSHWPPSPSYAHGGQASSDTRAARLGCAGEGIAPSLSAQGGGGMSPGVDVGCGSRTLGSRGCTHLGTSPCTSRRGRGGTASLVSTSSMYGGCASPPRVGGQTPPARVRCHHHAPLSTLLLSAVHPSCDTVHTQPSTVPLQGEAVCDLGKL
jgi:hypothetical protein